MNDIVSMDRVTKSYIDSNIKLAKSIIFKFDPIAKMTNLAILEKNPSYQIDLDAPNTWKYYLNLNGSYHETDELMYIRSLDTGELILLTKSSISGHVFTIRELKKFEDSYYRLVKQYPSQEILIQGIVFPVDIDTAIAAENMKVLNYNTELIEFNEYGLMGDIQQWLYNYSLKWAKYSYNLSDTLFSASLIGVIYLNLFQSIVNLRLSKAKTIETHSYHVKNYLDSHLNIGEFYRYMTFDQAMTIYRNILYYKNHSGLQYIFTDLISLLFTKRKINVFNYSIVQVNSLRRDGYVKYEIDRKWLNAPFNYYSKKRIDLRALADLESGISRYNLEEWNHTFEQNDFKVKNTNFSFLDSKDLSSQMTDQSNQVLYKFFNVYINHWAYMATQGYLKNLVYIDDTVSLDRYTLSSLDTFRLYIYLIHKRFNLDIESFTTYKVLRVLNPEITVEDEDIDFVSSVSAMRPYQKKSIATEIVNEIPKYRTINSVVTFSDHILNIYQYELLSWLYTSNIHDYYKAPEIEQIYNKCHIWTTVDISTGDTIVKWLTDNNLPDFDNYSDDQLDTLIYDLLDANMDYKLSSIFNLKNVQKAMTEIFKRLMSYSLQFLSVYTATDPIMVGTDACRFNVKTKFSVLSHMLNINKTDVEIKYGVSYKDSYLELPSIDFDLNEKYKSRLVYTSHAEVLALKRQSSTIGYNISNVLEIIKPDYILNSTDRNQMTFLFSEV